MLRISTRTSAESSIRYYTSSGSNRQEYLSQDGTVVGTWGGKCAVWLGVEGPVKTADFSALANNRDPVTNERVTIRDKANRRVGYDFNFNPSKSVSVVYALTKDARILDAFEQAVDEAMRAVEHDAMTRVRTDGFQDSDRSTGSMVWAKYTHLTTRPVSGVPDPHLHSHVFAFNITYDEAEHRFKALQVGPIKKNANYYQTLFHDRLASHLNAIGYETYPKGFAFEIANVPDSLLERFSKRSQTIQHTSNTLGLKTNKARSKVGALTREAKRADLSEADLYKAWSETLTHEERRAVELLKVAAPRIAPRKSDPAVVSRAVAYAEEHSFERQSVVTEHQLVAAAMRYSMGQIEPQDIRAAIRADKDRFLFRAAPEGQDLVTTPNVLAEEKRVVEWVRHGHRTCSPLASVGTAGSVSDPEIESALRHVFSSTDRVTAVTGVSGAGKTTLMTRAIPVINEALTKHGSRVVVVAPTAETGRGTLRKVGFSDAETVERFLMSPLVQSHAVGGVIWVDEASLLSIRDMARLFERAEHLNARIILSGDVRQHRSVQRGDAFRTLIQHAGVATADLRTIRRQSGLYKIAMEHLAHERLAEAFHVLDEMNAIVEAPDRTRHQLLANEYVAALERGETALIVSPTHREGRAVTAVVRHALAQRQRIRGERTFPVLRRVDLHLADQRLSTSYQNGFVIEAVRDHDRFLKGQRLLVQQIAESGLCVKTSTGVKYVVDLATIPDNFQIYERAELSVGIGDRIRITKNGIAEDRSPLNNATIHTVTGFTRTGDLVIIDDEGRSYVASRHYCHIDHGWFTTSYGAQSKTVDRVFVAESPESFGAANREQFYVSASRGRLEPRIFTEQKEALFEAVQASSRRLAALDVEPRPDPLKLTLGMHARIPTASISRSPEIDAVID